MTNDFHKANPDNKNWWMVAFNLGTWFQWRVTVRNQNKSCRWIESKFTLWKQRIQWVLFAQIQHNSCIAMSILPDVQFMMNCTCLEKLVKTKSTAHTVFRKSESTYTKKCPRCMYHKQPTWKNQDPYIQGNQEKNSVSSEQTSNSNTEQI